MIFTHTLSRRPIKIDYLAEIKRYRLPCELENELAIIFEKYGCLPARTRHTNNQLSYKTAVKRVANVCAALKDLHHCGHFIQKLGSFGERHVRVLVQLWEKKGIAIGTIENRVAFLRTLTEWIGKFGMIKKTSTYSIDPGSFIRTLITTDDKTWSGNGIDILDLIERVRLQDKIVALQLELMWAFGFRVEEAFLFAPVKGLNSALDKLIIKIEKGTKGGRLRLLDLDDVVQLDVLFRAGDEATGDSRSMIPRTYTLEGWRNHFYYILKKCGVRKDTANGGLGITSHGLRHEFLNQLFEHITGMPSPVKGGAGYDPENYMLALQIIVERAGHSDKFKAGAYLSTPRMMARLKTLLESACPENVGQLKG